MNNTNMWNQGKGYDQCNTLETLLKRDMHIKQTLTLDIMLCNCPTHHTHQMITSVKHDL